MITISPIFEGHITAANVQFDHSQDSWALVDAYMFLERTRRPIFFSNQAELDKDRQFYSKMIEFELYESWYKLMCYSRKLGITDNDNWPKGIRILPDGLVD